MSDKLAQAESNIRCFCDMSEKRQEDKLSKAEKDSSKTTTETIHGLMSQVMKVALFNKNRINNI